MREQLKGILAAGFGGTAVAFTLSILTPPLVAVSAGALTSFFVARPFGVQRHDDSVGTVVFLSFGTLVVLLSLLPLAFTQTPQLLLVAIGFSSAGLVLLNRNGSAVSNKLGLGDSATLVRSTTAKIRQRASARSGSDAFGSGIVSQWPGVTPATSAGPSPVSADDTTVPGPDEDVAQVVETRPSDGSDESFDSDDRTTGSTNTVDEWGAESTEGTWDDPDRRSDQTNGLQSAADRLGLPAEPGPVSEGIETMKTAVDAVVADTDAVDDGIVDRSADPVEQATSVKRAVDGGTLFAGAATAGDTTQRRGAEETALPELQNAVRTARTRLSPRTSEGQELLDALELTDDVSERHLTDMVGSVLERLNTQAELATALAEVDSTAEPQAIARHLDQRSPNLDGPPGTGLATIADELDEAVRDLEECRAEHQRLSEHAEAVCTAANDQTEIRFDSTASTDQWLAALAESVTNGSVSFTDQADDIGNLVSAAEGDIRPQSSLAQSVVEALRSDSMDADARERTIADALEAIDSTETLRHRLDDVSAEDVEALARRLERDLDEINTAGSAILADRVAELRQTVARADTADRMTVYAARQELRFYDQQLLDALQQTPDPSVTDGPVTDHYRDVEQRRSRMRTEYPTNYPNHDHSIPIHFLELVEALEESADQARTSGNEERAIGYLDAADRTLDWVAQLYDKHAYNVLLEQLRG